VSLPTFRVRRGRRGTLIVRPPARPEPLPPIGGDGDPANSTPKPTSPVSNPIQQWLDGHRTPTPTSDDTQI
jgi:hypothetical protein